MPSAHIFLQRLKEGEPVFFQEVIQPRLGDPGKTASGLPIAPRLPDQDLKVLALMLFTKIVEAGEFPGWVARVTQVKVYGRELRRGTQATRRSSAPAG